jgi:hypothetical protein
VLATSSSGRRETSPLVASNLSDHGSSRKPASHSCSPPSHPTAIGSPAPAVEPQAQPRRTCWSCASIRAAAGLPASHATSSPRRVSRPSPARSCYRLTLAALAGLAADLCYVRLPLCPLGQGASPHTQARQPRPSQAPPSPSYCVRRREVMELYGSKSRRSDFYAEENSENRVKNAFQYSARVALLIERIC